MIYVIYTAIFVYDLVSNGKTKRYARIYYSVYNFVSDEELNENFNIKDIKIIKKALEKNKAYQNNRVKEKA